MAERRDSMGAVTPSRGNAIAAQNAAPESSMPSAIWRAGSFLADGVWPPDLSRKDFSLPEVKSWISSLQAALRGASVLEIGALLEGLSIQYWSKDFSREDAGIMARQWAEDFAHVPRDILADACRTWRRTQNWYPKPAELLALISPMLARRKEALRSAEAVLNALERPARDSKANGAGDSWEAVEAKLAAKLRDWKAMDEKERAV